MILAARSAISISFGAASVCATPHKGGQAARVTNIWGAVQGNSKPPTPQIDRKRFFARRVIKRKSSNCLTQISRCIYYRYMKTMMSIKTDKEVKEGVQEFAREIGMPVSTIVNAYFRELLRTREFRVSAPPRMTPQLEKTIAVAERDYKRKKNLSPILSTKEEISRYFRAL